MQRTRRDFIKTIVAAGAAAAAAGAVLSAREAAAAQPFTVTGKWSLTHPNRLAESSVEVSPGPWGDVAEGPMRKVETGDSGQQNDGKQFIEIVIKFEDGREDRMRWVAEPRILR